MKARRGFSTSELTRQVRRLVAARLFLYLGAMSSYFIGVMGTLTFAMGAGVGDNAIAVALLNMCMVAGQVKGGGLLDRVGPQRYFRVAVAGLIASGLLYQVLGTSIVGVYVGAAVFGLAWGISDIIPRAFPAYLTGDMDELKRVNSMLTLVNNIATVVGPLVGGAIALVAPTQTVFLFMVGRVNAAMGAGYNLAGAIPLLCAPTLAHVFGVQGTLIAAGVAVAVVPLAILVVRRRELADLVRVERAVEERA